MNEQGTSHMSKHATHEHASTHDEVSTMTTQVRSTETTYAQAVQVRDAFVAGYMHAVAQHEDDMTEHMFGSRATFKAWHDGYANGRAYTGHGAWDNAAVSSALQSYHGWTVARALREAEAGHVGLVR